MAKAQDIANYFVELASADNESDLTNLKLQKLLYFAQGKYRAQSGVDLFDDEIEAWGYGPVVSGVYHKFKSCGSFPITVFDDGYSPAQHLDKTAKTFVQNIWQNIGLKYSASFLVKKTHAPGTPWKKVYKEGVNGIVIPKPSMEAYFKANSL